MKIETKFDVGDKVFTLSEDDDENYSVNGPYTIGKIILSKNGLYYESVSGKEMSPDEMYCNREEVQQHIADAEIAAAREVLARHGVT